MQTWVSQTKNSKKYVTDKIKGVTFICGRSDVSNVTATFLIGEVWLTCILINGKRIKPQISFLAVHLDHQDTIQTSHVSLLFRFQSNCCSENVYTKFYEFSRKLLRESCKSKNWDLANKHQRSCYRLNHMAESPDLRATKALHEF